MDSAFRDDLLERELELPAGGNVGDNGSGSLLSAKPTVRSVRESKQRHGRLRKLWKHPKVSTQRAFSVSYFTIHMLGGRRAEMFRGQFGALQRTCNDESPVQPHVPSYTMQFFSCVEFSTRIWST